MRLALSVVGFAMVVGCAVVVVGPQTDRSLRHGFGGWIATGGKRHLVWSTTEVQPSYLIFAKNNKLNGVQGTWPGVSGSHADPSVEGADFAWRVETMFFTELLGIWATTERRRTGVTEVGLFWTHSPSAPSESDENLRRTYWHLMDEAGAAKYPSSIPDLIATGRWNQTDVFWSGYVINIATIIGFGLWSCFTPLLIRDIWKSWQWKRRGACPKCGYDLRGLGDAGVCPECGSAMIVHNAGDVSPAPPRG